MRIDKFLWSVRFFKTRSIASQEIKKNRIRISGAVVKSSKEVMPGDEIQIRKNQIDFQIKVIDIPKSRVGAKLVGLYVKDTTLAEQYALLESRRLSQDHYRNKGEGRPTKKDRRDMDGFLDLEDTPLPAQDSEKELGELLKWQQFFTDQDEI